MPVQSQVLKNMNRFQKFWTINPLWIILIFKSFQGFTWSQRIRLRSTCDLQKHFGLQSLFSQTKAPTSHLKSWKLYFGKTFPLIPASKNSLKFWYLRFYPQMLKKSFSCPRLNSMNKEIWHPADGQISTQTLPINASWGKKGFKAINDWKPTKKQTTWTERRKIGRMQTALKRLKQLPESVSSH